MDSKRERQSHHQRIQHHAPCSRTQKHKQIQAERAQSFVTISHNKYMKISRLQHNSKSAGELSNIEKCGEKTYIRCCLWRCCYDCCESFVNGTWVNIVKHLTRFRRVPKALKQHWENGAHIFEQRANNNTLHGIICLSLSVCVQVLVCRYIFINDTANQFYEWEMLLWSVTTFAEFMGLRLLSSTQSTYIYNIHLFIYTMCVRQPVCWLV